MKAILIWAAIFGITGIVFGALGAHALKAVLEPEKLASFETGVRYQMYHALFLLFIALAQKTNLISNSKWVVRLTITGVFLFSFSIYLLAIQGALGVKLGFLGPVTPVGGLLLISAWVTFLVNVSKSRS